MKYYKRLKVYKGANLLLDVENERAVSYGWWLFLKRIRGKLVFNSYNYSPSTMKHQQKVKRQLSELGIRPDMVIQSPQGLDSPASAIHLYEERIRVLNELIAMPRTHAKKNEERKSQIADLSATLADIRSLYEE